MTIFNSAEVCIDKDFLLRNHGCPIPSGVDIYPLDVIPCTEEELSFQLQMMQIPYELLFDIEETSISQCVLDKVNELFKCQIVNDSNLAYQLIDLIEKVSQLYNNDGGERYSEYTALLSGENYIVNSKCFDKVEYKYFEGIEIPIPGGYEHILTTLYGDYMKPVQGGSSHCYPYYKEQEQYLLEMIRKAALNMSVTEYCDYVIRG